MREEARYQKDPKRAITWNRNFQMSQLDSSQSHETGPTVVEQPEKKPVPRIFRSLKGVQPKKHF